MSYFWFPRTYKIIWILTIACGIGWYLQETRPEWAPVPGTQSLAFRIGVLFAIALVGATVVMILMSWEHHIHAKPRRQIVEVSLVDKNYGGIVVTRKIPSRVWNKAEIGDRLVKPAGSLFVNLVPMNRKQFDVDWGENPQS